MSTLPGFTADYTLYRAESLYASNPEVKGSPTADGAIIPQYFTCGACNCIGSYCWKYCCYYDDFGGGSCANYYC